MIDVSIASDAMELAGFMSTVARIQDQFRFIRRSHPRLPEAAGESSAPPIRLYITDAPSCSLFFARYDKGVAVSTWQSEGICFYAGIEVEPYLVLCSLLGLTQWRALALNPLLRIDDFIHDADLNCLFTKRKRKQDYALLLENPALCQGCRDFYHCLGTDPELFAIQRAIDFVKAGPLHDGFPYTRQFPKPATVDRSPAR